MDDLYIKRVLKGDAEAYGYLIRQYQRMALRTAMSILKNESDAKDVVQESFIQAYESLGAFRQEAQFSTWICRIVINKSLRWRKKYSPSLHSNDLPADERLRVYNQGGQALDKADLENILKESLDRLAPKETLCIQLFYLEEFSVAEITQLTGFSKSNIKVLLHRGRKNLYHQLQSYYAKMK